MMKFKRSKHNVILMHEPEIKLNKYLNDKIALLIIQSKELGMYMP